MARLGRLTFILLFVWFFQVQPLEARVVFEISPFNGSSGQVVAEPGRPIPSPAADVESTSSLASPDQLLAPSSFNNPITERPLLAENAPTAPQQEPNKIAPERKPAVDEENDEEFDEDDEFEEEFGASMESKISDPFEGYNRAMTVFNDKLYFWLLQPVARGYRWIMPEFVRRGVVNFFNNILFPLRFVNNLLQFKMLNAGEELLRFLINTTIGVLGLWDPARDWFGLEAHKEDFGQTLGFWGLGGGPHIVLPVFGPSNLRDMFALVPDFYLDPKKEITPYEKELAIRAYDKVNDTSLHIGEYENLKKDAIDLYPFLRDVYEQNRIKKIAE